MDKSKQILYFGLDPSRYNSDCEVLHFPLIQTKPFPFETIAAYLSIPHTHVLFTSRMAVTYFFGYTSERNKKYICVGEATAGRLSDFGVKADWVADEPCGEGVIALLETLECGHILYPHSAQARTLLPHYLEGKGTPFPLYETIPNQNFLPDLSAFDRLVFTSPSTVRVFSQLCSALPPREKCEAIGPITQNALNKLFESTIL